MTRSRCPRTRSSSLPTVHTARASCASANRSTTFASGPVTSPPADLDEPLAGRCADPQFSPADAIERSVRVASGSTRIRIARQHRPEPAREPDGCRGGSCSDATVPSLPSPAARHPTRTMHPRTPDTRTLRRVRRADPPAQRSVGTELREALRRPSRGGDERGPDRAGGDRVDPDPSGPSCSASAFTNATWAALVIA